MTKRKSKKVKITENSTYYKWIEGVGGNVKIYPCEHEKVDYKALQKLQDKTMKELKKADAEVERLQQQLSNCLRMVKENNKWHNKRLERYAKLYVAYKEKYKGLFTLREAAKKMGITEEEEKEVSKDFDFKHETKTLESGKVVNQFLLKKKNTKH